MRKLVAVAALAIAVAAPAAGAAVHGNVVTVSASPSALKFVPATLHAKAGRVTIAFNNPSATMHNVRIEQGEREFGGTKTIAKGRTRVTLTLRKGTYAFYCSVPGHEDAGMKGTLVVA